MNPRAELEKRYPLADFSVYFRHLSASHAEKRSNTQEHHICPRKQFPEYAEGFPENLIMLHTDDHIFAHKLLEAACGIKAPYSALLIAQRSCAARAAKIGGLIGGPRAAKKNKQNGTGVYSEKVQRIGALAAGQRHKEKKTGVCGLTTEQLREAGRKGALARRLKRGAA